MVGQTIQCSEKLNVQLILGKYTTQGKPIAAVKQNNCFEKLSKYHMKTLEMEFF